VVAAGQTAKAGLVVVPAGESCREFNLLKAIYSLA
jgi:hypothetical protein